MHSHPLAQDDYDTVQAYMATRVAALLSVSTHPQDWEVEVGTQQDQSAGQWERRNGFLFDYTLGRFLQAVNEAHALRHDTNVHLQPIATDSEQFAHDFTSAITRQDAQAAEWRWQEFNGLPYWPDRAPIALPSTLALIKELQRVTPSIRLAGVTSHLPEPFDPPVVVS